MEEIIQNVYLQGGVVMVAVNFIIGFVKKWVPTKWLPLIALGLPAIAGGIYAAVQGAPIWNTVLMGLTIGGVSMGAYDVKKSVKK